MTIFIDHELTGEPRNPDYCWEWWGSSAHRMRCRRLKGHEGEHFDHPDCENSTHITVATDGLLAALSSTEETALTVEEARCLLGQFRVTHHNDCSPIKCVCHIASASAKLKRIASGEGK